MEALLKVDNLNVNFRTDDGVINVIKNVSFDVREKEIVGIVGESGCGKSMTSLAIMGLVPKNGQVSGSILFEEKDLVNLPKKELGHIRGNRISMIFQDPMKSLNPVYTIGEQIDETIREHLKVNKDQAKQKTLDILGRVGIPNPERIYKSYPHELSGGMKQRIIIAMALVCSPKLVIADEPTTALDVTIQAQILELMREMRSIVDTSIILITHDLGVLAEMCDRVIVMYAGEVVEENTVEALFEHPMHPYTKGLLDSIPKMDEEQDILPYIPGQVPPPGKFPTGCRFSTRCPQAAETCFQSPPDLYERAGGKVRCWLWEAE
ncbi:ABC transporter ATP-binding protein [Brevibacillus sp. B_LB10_24]|uniref:ABC transporter ATP-binding protein n=1 Tax=Brevibacillus sp. B_LB10_24 TaxID=3380645 RepID=UPI0038B98963